ncbi:Ramosa1 enhancer locus 2 protein [Carex littledalei]|uniref:Ramosa1 enhancer locus 2 protein n=1 Tax=Carex littledalei TaxID=544730 RepID=A0A833VIZ9_9POAL|nr:Ramosa1 enhancer locus 2 protein [Carex littledalei]
MPVLVQYWYNTWYGNSSFENDRVWHPCCRLEQESGFFFNMKYFEEKVIGAEWDEVEKYLSGFTKVDDNCYSMKIFFEIRKQKYLEALDKHDRAKAVEILVKDLKVFSTFNEELYKEITQLLTLDNFRFMASHGKMKIKAMLATDFASEINLENLQNLGLICQTTASKSGALRHDIHYWLGKDTSQDEAGSVAILTVELDEALGGGPVQYREVQGDESEKFLSYFKPCIIPQPGGTASGPGREVFSEPW